MGLETGTTIAQLNSAWPLGTDPRSQGDDHLRLVKAVVKNDAVSKALTTVQAIGGALTLRTNLELAVGGSNIVRGIGNLHIMTETGATIGFRIGATGTISDPIVARISEAGSDATFNDTVMTRDKGDFRYLKLTGGTLTGGITLPSLRIGTEHGTSIGAATGPLNLYSADGSVVNLRTGPFDGPIAAQVAAPGTAAGSSVVIMTREKGDARYLQPGAAGPVRLSDLWIGGAPGGAPATTTISAVTGSDLRLRGGIDTAAMVQIFSAAGVNVARFDQAGTAAVDDQTVITREKGDARYLLDPGVNVVGSYAFLKVISGSAAPGGTLAGTALKYSNTLLSESTQAVSGTWIALGSANTGTATLFQRVS